MDKRKEWRPFHEWLAENGRLPCKVEGCTKKRYGQGVYCTYHKSFYVRWGHPLARAIPLSHFSQEVEDITKLVERNPSHPGIAWGVNWLNKCMEAAAAGADVGGPGLGKYFAHLNDCRYMPEPTATHRIPTVPRDKFETIDLLILLAAITLMYERDELKRVIKNHRHYVILLGRNTVLFPRSRGGLEIPDTSFRKVGPFIQKKLGVLLLNMARSCEAMLTRELTDRQVVNTEFNI